MGLLEVMARTSGYLKSHSIGCLDPFRYRKSTRQAILQIVIADISMSLDNVLAVAGIAREHPFILVFGLALSVGLMAFGATFFARLLERYHWIAYVGLAVILQVALVMIWEGSNQVIAIAFAN